MFYEVALNILQKYIFREWFWTLLAVTFVLLVVMIGVALGEILNDIAGGRMPSGLLWTLIALKIPDVLGTILPLSVFIAVIWGLVNLDRVAEQSEQLVSTGVSAAESNRRINEQLSSLERSARQYQILKNRRECNF